jgi:hypothetical protein
MFYDKLYTKAYIRPFIKSKLLKSYFIATTSSEGEEKSGKNKYDEANKGKEGPGTRHISLTV